MDAVKTLRLEYRALLNDKPLSGETELKEALAEPLEQVSALRADERTLLTQMRLESRLRQVLSTIASTTSNRTRPTCSSASPVLFREVRVVVELDPKTLDVVKVWLDLPELSDANLAHSLEPAPVSCSERSVPVCLA